MKFLHPSTIYSLSYGLLKSFFWQKTRTETLFIEEMMIPHINIKSSLKFTSDDTGTKEDINVIFQALLEKSTSFIYSEISNT